MCVKVFTGDSKFLCPFSVEDEIQELYYLMLSLEILVLSALTW